MRLTSHAFAGRRFITAGELLDALWEESDENEDEDLHDEDMNDDYNRLCAFVHGAFAEALREVRNAGIFGEEVTLNLMGDQGNDERLENAALLNDAATVERRRDDLAGYIPVSP